MIKPWSISTTVRNPERIRDFLFVLKKMEGNVWNAENQRKFQILLIQYKMYGYGNNQFYNGLSTVQKELMSNQNIISYEDAEGILDTKNYIGGGDMRGRQSYNPLEKMGLVFLDENKKLRISEFGNYFLQENYDLGEVFFKSFLKWQLPNFDERDYKEEDGYNIKPFIATLHLIDKVNKICKRNNEKEKGISRLEFKLFALTLYNYENIEEQAQKLYSFRKQYEDTEQQEINEFINNYIEDKLSIIDGINNLNDYADNAIRYFRLTRYIYLRGNGYYIDLEPRRKVEIDLLLKTNNASAKTFNNKEEFREYLCDINKPILPWNNRNNLINILNSIENDIRNYISKLRENHIEISNYNFKDYNYLQDNGIQNYIEELRNYRKHLQQIEIHYNSQQIASIEQYIDLLTNIYNSKNKTSIELERLCTLSLNALNDAIEIRPNYPVGDDNEPTFTAPANKPDIECYYEDFNSICEVTMLKDRSQWFNEGQPVMRHLKDFEDGLEQQKPSYCLFIAPTLHRDTINTYWNAIKYEYEGTKQKIVPLTINEFLVILKKLLHRKQNGQIISHMEMKTLYDNIVYSTNNYTSSDEWIKNIPNIINSWGDNIN